MNISKTISSKKLSFNINILPYFLDHKFENKPVLPAVEAMKLLAQTALPYLEEKKIICFTNTDFKRFVPIPSDKKNILIFINIDFYENNCVRVTLMTQILSGKMKIRRIKEHVSLNLLTLDNIDNPLNLSAIKKECFKISNQQIYKELVLFGPAYHNIKKNLKITENQVDALVYAGNFPDCSSFSGSPFPLDAAFHAACVWAQRYAGIVAFPVGLDKRYIINPTKPGNLYSARIKPVQKNLPLLIFDMEIYTLEGTICEIISGVKMQDISRGRLKPPDWVSKDLFQT